MEQNTQTIVRVQTDDFDIQALQTELCAGLSDVGAIATFVGTVRDVSTAQNVRALTLEHYPGMTEASMQTIVDEACARWDVLRVCALHRIGRLELGAQIVYVGVSSRHRKAALAACEYVIDQLKTKAVLWKKEENENGQEWLLPTSADSDIADSY